MKKLLPILLIVFLFAGCDVPIDLDLQQTPPQIAIEALVTNRPGQPFVRLTLSADFYYEGSADRITDAVVTLRNDLGQSVAVTHY